MYRPDIPDTAVSLMLPPYAAFSEVYGSLPVSGRGVAVIWSLFDALRQRGEFDWLQRRPPNISLIILLPPPGGVTPVLPLLRELSSLRPRGVLPNSGDDSAEAIRLLLASAPRDLTAWAVSHLSHEGVLRDAKVRGLVRRIFDAAATVPSISQLSRKMYMSRRTLGRAFEAANVPVPSHWLQLARLLHVCALIQERRSMPIFRLATHVGYPDGFTMSNQMKRLIGCRPSEVREHLGLQWVLEAWLERECAAGRLHRLAMPNRCDDLQEWLRLCPARRQEAGD